MSSRPVWSAVAAAFAVGVGFFVAGIVVPQFVVLPEASGLGFGLSATEAGLLLLPGALAMLVGAWTSGRLAGRLGARRLVVLGALCSGAGYLALALAHGSEAEVAASLLAQGFGTGLAVAAVVNLAAQAAGFDRTGITVALAGVSRTAGAALGAQVAAAIIVSAGLVGGFPADSGIAWAFGMAAIASLAAAVVTVTIPTRTADPLTRQAAGVSTQPQVP
jgi:MFS family permease